MRDNFDLQGYLRKNNKLLNESFEGFGGYRDLNPLNEIGEDVLSNEEAYFAENDMEEAQDDNPLYGAGIEANSWMEEVDGTGEYEVGQFKCYYDYPGYLVWSYGEVPFDKFAVYATPMFDGQDGTPVQVEVNDKTVANLDIPKGTFKNFQDYARTMIPVLTKLVEKYSDQFEGELEELEKPEKIYADDDSEEFGSYQERMLGLGGDRIEQGIISLLDDGFEAEDVMDLCKMFIDAHSEAKAQGKKF